MRSNQDLLSENLRLDDYSVLQLREGAKWARFLSIMGFILTGIVALMAFGANSILSNASMEAGAEMSPAVLMMIYLIAAGINFVLSLFLYRFATRALSALNTNDQDALSDSFRNLKLVFKITGILVIIYIGLILIAMLAGIAFMASR